MKRIAPFLAAVALLGLGCQSDLIDGLPTLPDDTAPPFDPGERFLPPISGGTLALTPDGATAVVGDSERDKIYLVDIDPREIRAIFDVSGEPGRVVVDQWGERAYVALRRGAGVIVVDVREGRLVDRWRTCPSPRGLALTPDESGLYVACLGGQLLTHDAETGFITRRIEVAPDLRDVIAFEDRIVVTRFRAAELITLSPAGEVLHVRRPAGMPRMAQTAVVAWRTVGTPDGRVLMLHQVASDNEIMVPPPEEPPPPGEDPPEEPPGGDRPPPPITGYGMGGACGEAIVGVAVTEFGPHDDGSPWSGVVSEAVLGVDLAVDETRLVIAAPGSVQLSPEQAPFQRVPFRNLATFDRARPVDCLRAREAGPTGAFTAVALRPDDRGGVAFQREPAALVDLEGNLIVALPVESTADEGHDLFHKAPGAGLACASCHPEGSEDGHVWQFRGFGPRRTQELRGGIADSAPFHWQQDMRDMAMLLREVMHGRMGGVRPTVAQADALSSWLDALPAPRVAPIGEGDPIAGELVFEDASTGCAGCHNGPRYSDGRAYDVGTGEALETASLIGVGRRARLLHDGCADTLAGRFDEACGGRNHGRVIHLSVQQMQDLIAFLRTL